MQQTEQIYFFGVIINFKIYLNELIFRSFIKIKVMQWTWYMPNLGTLTHREVKVIVCFAEAAVERLLKQQT